MLYHIESESHACISPLFPAVIFVIVQQASLLMQESTWLSITNWKIHSKVTFLPCIGKKHNTFIQNVYLRERERERGKYGLFINYGLLIHAYQRKTLFSFLS